MNCILKWCLPLSLLPLSCHNSKVSNEYSEVIYQCGDNLSSSKYLEIKNSDDKNLLGSAVRILRRDSEGRIHEDVKASSKGCLPTTAVESSQLVYIGTTRADGKLEGTIVSPDSLSSMKGIQLKPIPDQQPQVNCHKRFVQDRYLDVMSFLSFEMAAPWSLFYSINAEIGPSKDSAFISRAFNESLPLLSSGSIWDITHIPAGAHELRLQVTDHVRNRSISDLSCDIDTADYQLDVDLAAPIVRFANIFGQRFGVVDEGYTPNFYINDDLERLNIKYCVKSIEPDAKSIPETCDVQEVIDWKTSAPQALKSGFYRLIFQAQMDDVQSKWIHRDILVNKVCTGDFEDVKRVNELGCNEILGNLRIRFSETLGFAPEAKGLVRISGGLTFENSALNAESGSFYAPNLSEVGSMTVSGSFVPVLGGFQSLERVHGDLNVATYQFLQNNRYRVFPKLRVVGGKLTAGLSEIPANALAKLESVGSLEINDCFDISGFNGMKRIFGSLTVSNCDELVTLDGFSALQDISDSLTIENNPKLEMISTFKRLASVRDITLSASPKASSLPQFQQLKTLANNLVITNWGMTNAEGLSQITAIDGGLSFSENEKLESLAGLEKLTYVGGLNLTANRSLTSVNGLGQLKIVGETLAISANPILETIEGLSSLTEIGTVAGSSSFGLVIDQSIGLKSLRGLENLQTLSASLYLVGNTSLEDISAIKSVEPFEPGVGFVEISGNNIAEEFCPDDAVFPGLGEFCSEFANPDEEDGSGDE
ncbi:MAG: hypothetical protein HRU19_27835 [Pseudobacteriovorax sp.]|nr:hypothetical protein [Pseudobacteriovorax sp.]